MKQPSTIGILHPGEMGASLGRLLRARGIPVVTTVEGRSERTARLCRAAKITVVGSVHDVLSRSDLVISTVPPAAAVSVAHRVAADLPAGRPPMIYLDANSVSPMTMRQIGQVLRPPRFLLVDASIHGLAARLTENAVMYLSGPSASKAAAIVGEPPRTIVLGDDIGQASLLKMLLGGTSKGLVALLIELSDLGLREGMLDEFWIECRRFYPGVIESFERLLPTYGQHIRRRMQEMGELELTLTAARRQPIMAAAVRILFSRTAKSPKTLRSLVERISAAASREGKPRLR